MLMRMAMMTELDVEVLVELDAEMLPTEIDLEVSAELDS